MEITIIRFDDIKIPKQKFHQHKRPVSIKNVGIDKIVVSNKVPFCKEGFKYFIGYKDSKTSQTFMCISTKNDCI